MPPGTPRPGRYRPITAPLDAQPPGWVVSCLDCPFSADAHGATKDAAVKAVAETHQAGHRMIAVEANYSTHPMYAGG